MSVIEGFLVGVGAITRVVSRRVVVGVIGGKVGSAMKGFGMVGSCTGLSTATGALSVSSVFI